MIIKHPTLLYGLTKRNNSIHNQELLYFLNLFLVLLMNHYLGFVQIELNC